MSKRVNNRRGKRFAGRHVRHNRMAVEQLHAFRVLKIKEDPGFFLRVLGCSAPVDMREGSRDMTTSWELRSHKLPQGRNEMDILRWRAGSGDIVAADKLARMGHHGD